MAVRLSLLLLLAAGCAQNATQPEKIIATCALEGTLITCPKDGQPLYRINHSLVRGEVIIASYFDAARPEIAEPVSGQLMACPFDGELWGRSRRYGYTQIHTESGWCPKDEDL